MGLRGTEPTIISAFYKSRAPPKQSLTGRKHRSGHGGRLRRGVCVFFPGQPCSGTAEPVWLLQGARTRDEAANYREKAEPELSVELHVHEEGSVGKGWW